MEQLQKNPPNETDLLQKIERLFLLALASNRRGTVNTFAYPQDYSTDAATVVVVREPAYDPHSILSETVIFQQADVLKMGQKVRWDIFGNLRPLRD